MAMSQSNAESTNLIQMPTSLDKVSGDLIMTMSSREIAELTGKRHNDALRDIQKTLKELEKHCADLRNDDSKGVRVEYDHRNFVSAYHLPKLECYVLITGYSVVLRSRVNCAFVGCGFQITLVRWFRPELSEERDEVGRGSANKDG
jgi:hypothetical protein